ncbi:hypothetical protein, partial [Pseudomonas mediterranea]|uniref:hypothetical protein n=1 Tax=Pseudomonas mediterranea TaxID=183795 RepID=UPI001E334024
ELARDSGGPACIGVECATIASRLAPTLSGGDRDSVITADPLWEPSLLAIAVDLPASMLNVPPSRAGSLPHYLAVTVIL